MPPRRPKGSKHDILSRHRDGDLTIPQGMRTPRELLKKRMRVSVRLDEELGLFMQNYGINHRMSITQVIEAALKMLKETTQAKRPLRRRDGH